MARPSKRIMHDVADVRAWAEKTDNVVSVEETTDEPNTFTLCVSIKGPEETPYAGGVFRLRVQLRTDAAQPYPLSSPSVRFVTPVWHPNIDCDSGAVCLDVLRQRWLPVTRLVDVFAVYLPLLLQSPEPRDPMNATAASQLSHDAARYQEYVRLYTTKHATPHGADVVLPPLHSNTSRITFWRLN